MHVATIRQTVAPRSRGRLWTRAAWGTGVLLAALAGAAQADSGYPGRVDRASTVQQGPVSVSVRVEGQSAPLFHAWNRPDRWYLQAAEGARYEVQVRNVTARRVGFVLSVDGLNAVSGVLSSRSPNEPMYVLGPYESATIKGWRRNLNQVNRFVFVDEQRSYAERTDQGNGDLGWIRVVAFYERQPEISLRQEPYRPSVIRGGRASDMPAVPAPAPMETRKSAEKDQAGTMGAPPAEGMASPQAARDSYAPRAEDSHPGTGWGAKERDRVREVEFSPEPYAAAHVILRYEYRSALVSLGILPWRDGNPDRLWERESGVYGFAQPPRH